eukprot:scaffold26407_cov127-Cylindrotheca_fusiformis.AAC.1
MKLLSVRPLDHEELSRFIRAIGGDSIHDDEEAKLRFIGVKKMLVPSSTKRSIKVLQCVFMYNSGGPATNDTSMHASSKLLSICLSLCSCVPQRMLRKDKKLFKNETNAKGDQTTIRDCNCHRKRATFEGLSVWLYEHARAEVYFLKGWGISSTGRGFESDRFEYFVIFVHEDNETLEIQFYWMTSGNINNAGSRSKKNAECISMEHGKIHRILANPASFQSTSVIMTEFANEEGPEGCYLIFEPMSGGRLILFYSRGKIPLNAIGFWCPGPNRSIQGFKFKQGNGQVEIIKGIAGGDQNRRKYYSGWCQFIKQAKAMDGYVIKFPNSEQGVEVDIIGYKKENEQPIELDLDE